MNGALHARDHPRILRPVMVARMQFSAVTPCPRERSLGRGERCAGKQELCRDTSRNAPVVHTGQQSGHDLTRSAQRNCIGLFK